MSNPDFPLNSSRFTFSIYPELAEDVSVGRFTYPQGKQYLDFSRKVVLFATRVGRIDKSAKAATGRNEIKRTKRIAWGRET